MCVKDYDTYITRFLPKMVDFSVSPKSFISEKRTAIERSANYTTPFFLETFSPYCNVCPFGATQFRNVFFKKTLILAFDANSAVSFKITYTFLEFSPFCMGFGPTHHDLERSERLQIVTTRVWSSSIM